MSTITGKIYQQMNAAGTENRFPRTVVEAVLGLSSYLQQQFGALSDIYMPIEGINQAKPNQEFVYRQTPNTIKAKELTLDRIKGKTLAWNQSVQNGNFGKGTDYWSQLQEGTFTVSNNVATLTWHSPYSNNGIVSKTAVFTAGHKHYAACYIKNLESSSRNYHVGQTYGVNVSGSFASNEAKRISGILNIENASGQGYGQFCVFGDPDRDNSINVTGIELVDLTILYGSAISGMTDAEILAKFEAEYAGYFPYNSSSLISNDTKQLETVGRNLWDEEVELCFLNSDGSVSATSERITTSFIPVLPNTTYYQKCPDVAGYGRVAYYDADRNCVGTDINNGLVPNATFTTGRNVYYVRVTFGSSYGSTYNNDICINLSDSSFNGQYVPYKKSVDVLNLDNIKVHSPNIWDEEWEEGYYTEAGVKSYAAGSGNVMCKNPIPVLPNTTYYFREGTNYGYQILALDSGKNAISVIISWSNDSATFTTPSGCRFIVFYFYQQGNTTYNHDITINKSDPAFNGRYFPAGVITITGGLRRSGSAYDEIVGGKLFRRTGELLGSDMYDHNTSSAGYKSYRYQFSKSDGLWANVINSFGITESGSFDSSSVAKEIMQWGGYDNDSYFAVAPYRNKADIKFYYALQYPEVYDLAEPIPMSMPAGTTEARISPNADGLSAPFCADITYGMGATEYAETAGVALNAISTQYAEATARLLNARTIWGQSFDGSANISGALSGVTNLNSKLYFSGANVGIGTSSPQYSLDVSGTFHASGNTEIGGSLIVDGDLTVPQYAGLNFEGASDVWLASLGLNSNADQLIVSFGADNDHVLLHDGNYTSYSPSLTQFNTSNGVLAEGIASNASRLDSLEDWLTDPRLTSLYSDSLSADSLNVPGSSTLGAVTATSLVCAALSSVGNINSKIYFSGANVGIANSSPSYGLDVAGTFRATGNAEFGGNVYLRNSVLIPKQITSYGEIEIGEVTENCFQIDDYGNALFEDVALRGMLLFHYYDSSEGDFVDGEVGYNGSNYYFDHAINAPAFNQTSDARLKTNLSPVALTIEQIASAPAVEFNWIGNGQRSAGSIAQYWENTLPYNVHENGGMLAMEYGNIALISAITCAREIQKLEARIKELEAKLNQ